MERFEQSRTGGLRRYYGIVGGGYLGQTRHDDRDRDRDRDESLPIRVVAIAVSNKLPVTVTVTVRLRRRDPKGRKTGMLEGSSTPESTIPSVRCASV